MGDEELFVDADESKCSVYFEHSIEWHYISVENRDDVINFMKKEPYRGRLLVDVAHFLRPRFGLDRNITLSIEHDCAHFNVNLIEGEDAFDDAVSTILEVYNRVREDHASFELVDICIDAIPPTKE